MQITDDAAIPVLIDQFSCNCQSLEPWGGPWHPCGDTPTCPHEDVVQCVFDCLPDMDEREAWNIAVTTAVQLARQHYLVPQAQ